MASNSGREIAAIALPASAPRSTVRRCKGFEVFWLMSSRLRRYGGERGVGDGIDDEVAQVEARRSKGGGQLVHHAVVDGTRHVPRGVSIIVAHQTLRDRVARAQRQP